MAAIEQHWLILMHLLQRQLLGGMPDFSGAIAVDIARDLVYDFCELLCLEKERKKKDLHSFCDSLFLWKLKRPFFCEMNFNF